MSWSRTAGKVAAPRVGPLQLAVAAGRYSKLGPTGVKVARAAESARQNRRSEPWVSPEVSVTTVRRMTPDEIAAMVADYRSGIGSWRLARKYGVSDSTVLARLKAAGVALNPARQAEARRAVTEDMLQLREEGHTLTEVGERYGITRQAVSLRLARYRERS